MSLLFLIGGVIVGLALLAIVGSGIFWFLIQIGVIAHKAMEPPTQDHGSYSLDQGHDVGRKSE